MFITSSFFSQQNKVNASTYSRISFLTQKYPYLSEKTNKSGSKRTEDRSELTNNKSVNE